MLYNIPDTRINYHAGKPITMLKSIKSSGCPRPELDGN